MANENRFEALRDKLAKALTEAQQGVRAGFGVAGETPDGQPKGRPYGQVALPESDAQAFADFQMRQKLGLTDANVG